MATTELESKEVDKRDVETSARASDGIFMAKYVLPTPNLASRSRDEQVTGESNVFLC